MYDGTTFRGRQKDMLGESLKKVLETRKTVLTAQIDRNKRELQATERTLERVEQGK